MYFWLGDPHRTHIGPGGCLSAPQSSHCCIRSSPCRVPSQKNAVSGETTGRMTNPPPGPPDCPAAACRSDERVLTPCSGRNLSIRKSIVATISSPLYQDCRVVKNQP